MPGSELWVTTETCPGSFNKASRDSNISAKIPTTAACVAGGHSPEELSRQLYSSDYSDPLQQPNYCRWSGGGAAVPGVPVLSLGGWGEAVPVPVGAGQAAPRPRPGEGGELPQDHSYCGPALRQTRPG